MLFRSRAGPLEGKLAQWRIAMICTIVQGALITAAGALLLLVAVLFVVVGGTREMPRESADVFAVFMGVLGAALAAPGAFQIFAGVRGRRFRSRWVVFVGLLAGVPALFLCTCFVVTAIPLAAWGLVLLYDPIVRERFEREQTSGAAA